VFGDHQPYFGCVDTHLYLVHHTMAVGDGDLDNYLATIAGELPGQCGLGSARANVRRTAPVWP
jgi:hypothetical protein